MRIQEKRRVKLYPIVMLLAYFVIILYSGTGKYLKPEVILSGGSGYIILVFMIVVPVVFALVAMLTDHAVIRVSLAVAMLVISGFYAFHQIVPDMEFYTIKASVHDMLTNELTSLEYEQTLKVLDSSIEVNDGYMTYVPFYPTEQGKLELYEPALVYLVTEKYYHDYPRLRRFYEFYAQESKVLPIDAYVYGYEDVKERLEYLWPNVREDATVQERLLSLYENGVVTKSEMRDYLLDFTFLEEEERPENKYFWDIVATGAIYQENWTDPTLNEFLDYEILTEDDILIARGIMAYRFGDNEVLSEFYIKIDDLVGKMKTEDRIRAKSDLKKFNEFYGEMIK